MKVIKHSIHILIVFILTLITQIGGLVWVLVFGFFKFKYSSISRINKLLVFLTLYLTTTFFIIPYAAKLNSRTPLPVFRSGNLIPHNIITPILNRHYVKPILKSELNAIANKINDQNENLKVSYLDANFPFIDGFPLLPHLSHNDGRKIDLSFYYKRYDEPGNLKPSNTGYGKYVKPEKGEANYTSICKSKGYWQYDFTKFLTLGGRNDLTFDAANTKQLVQLIVSNPVTQKLLIEPHLKDRLNLMNDKVRFHGCHAVRHDDHIHYQINK